MASAMAMPRVGDNHNLHILQQTLDLCVSCNQCCKSQSEISFTLQKHSHQCFGNKLLARQRGKDNLWKLVGHLPKSPKPSKYKVCWHYYEGKGCVEHRQRCTYARSEEEAHVWNFMKKERLKLQQLIDLLGNDTTFPTQQEKLDDIIRRLDGTFLELCKTCFHDSPQVIALKVSDGCDSGHGWNPVFIFCQKDKKKGVTYNEVRPLPKQKLPQWNYCKFTKKGKPCRLGAQSCLFAHNEVEMIVWMSESMHHLDRSSLLHASQRLQSRGSRDQTQQYYCQICKCQFPMYESFMNHCFTVEHTRLILEDNTSTWRYRDPPLTSKTFKLCKRKQTCEYGDNCMKAHSMEELKEWKRRRRAAQQKAEEAADKGLLSYQDYLLEEYRHTEDEEMIMKEFLPGVSVDCESELSIYVRQEKISHRWKFNITSESALEVVALLKREIGATFSLGEDSREECSFSTGNWFENQDTSSPEKKYEITVSFTSDRPGLYEQWLVLDFDMRPVLRKKLRACVGEHLFPQFEQYLDFEVTQQNVDASGTLDQQKTQRVEQVPIIWHDGIVEIVPYLERTEEHEQLLKTYSHVKMKESSTATVRGLINHQNYKKKMHSFLYQEEMAQDQSVGRMNIRATMSLHNHLFGEAFGFRNAISGKLFGSVSVPYTLTSNTQQGYLLKRHVHSVLVAPLRTDCDPQRVYEAEILKDAVGETKLNLQLSNRCCTELQLQSNTEIEMEIQFQLNRIHFCELHKAVDILPDLERVLPDLTDRNVLAPMKSNSSELNERQQAAMDFILGGPNQRRNSAPLLIYGPFGTGKTFTLAKITLALAQQPHNKILICTHTNSSADLYVKDHFHGSVTTTNHPARPLRIKAKEINVSTTDDITLEYCHLSKNQYGQQTFDFPDRETLDGTRIIITTTRVARFFHDMQLPSNYFSHILIDEASQMLECEALMALGLAGEKTQVVLAGDHMQMGPRLFSVGVDKSSDRTLLSRLFHYYQAENTTTAKNSRIIFNENYRSTKEIVDFVSTHFYVGKKDVIKAKGNAYPLPDQKALQFYHAPGECFLDNRSMSWFNPVQIQTVVEVVLKVLNAWPMEWLHPDPASLCVLSQGSQVIAIRSQLKQYGLRDVTVENAENVQGKEFRVIIVSTVHTKDSINMTEQQCLEFFNDVRLLNTVMTRAQSQVIVVGDATALCCSHFGKCWRLWMSYINHCSDTGSVHPEEFTIDCLKQELLEISNIIKKEEDDSSDGESETSEIPDSEDPILKELLDENNDLQIKLTDDGLFPHFHTDSLENNVVRLPKVGKPPEDEQHEMCQNNNNRICELVLDRYDFGFARPLDKPSIHIEIKGKENVGCAITGDEVKVEILPSETFPLKGKVIEVLKHAALSKEFVCCIDTHDNQLMVPINICIPKLFTPFWKDKPNHIAIRNPKTWAVEKFVVINEETRRNNLFVVKFLRWGKGFLYPLGIAVDVLPKVTSLQDGLKVLEKEYNLNRTIPLAVQSEMANLTDASLAREDFRNLMTFTIDPSHSEDLDDAISVRDLGECYEIGVHIADVASLVMKDSALDKYARQQGTTFYVSESEPTHMFPQNLSTKLFSLQPNYDRCCISLMTEVDKKTDRIQKRTFYKSVICSKKRLSYDDAETILNTSENQYSFDTVEGCLAIAYHFAEVHRKDRKQEDWCYKSPDEDVDVGRRQSHILVEELMVMFNHTVADRLLFDQKTKSLTPLRCQDRPNSDQLHDFLKSNVAWLPMSIHLSSKGNDYTPEAHEQLSLRGRQLSCNTENDEHFPILTTVLKNLKTAALDKDIYRIVDLITTDDIHPKLLPLVIRLRRLLSKAQVLRANSSHLSRIGHYDLQLDSYTWASSPIRRYIDVIVQRLLHSVLEKTEINYTSYEIDKCCVEFSQNHKDQMLCQKKSEALSFASQLSSQNAQKLAYIVEVLPMENNFRISFPQNTNSIPELVRVMYKDLQLADQPMYYETDDCTLKWVRRVYSFSNDNIRKELKQQQANSVITYIPPKNWKSLVAAIREENWDLLLHLITQIKTERPVKQKPVTTSRVQTSSLKEEHYAELSLKLKKGKIIEVQLGTDTHRGLLVPAIQLLIVNPKFEVCVEHTKNPIMCFSKYALRSTRASYKTYMEYQQIWKPLCEMESASSAVAENESIVIEDVVLNWKSSKEPLQGSFQLPLEKKAQWVIDVSLRDCFLCIRLRIPQKDLNPKDSLTHYEDLELKSVPGLIWVAHGVVTKVLEEEKSNTDSYMEINFRINHMPMTNTPESVFRKSARFTVELIPKLLPDVRKENAIDNLRKANNLVKAIATGKNTSDKQHKIQTRLPTRLEITDHQSLGFPQLNDSQYESIRKALNNEFTLIQGPPGTGKTVVGVHIVYWFFQENKKNPALKKVVDKDAKKRCILYCGPSNKSVDVVAGQLLKLQNDLKPLRVYSDQMEILEFPYPGSNLKVSRHSRRVEIPNEDIRSITLHHKIRKPSNPFSAQIQAFDLKIQRDQHLTDEELKTYKDCLKKARKHELLEHDVILCTCTAASHPLLATVLSVQQIVIDECAMATEPEAFIPLVTHKPKQIVLLGDHKQLQPVLRCESVKKLGITTSLFERYMQKALLLDTQYRMQEDICAFPSEEFYEGRLKTGTEPKPRPFQTISKRPTSIIFGHVKGQEITLVVSTEQGNENSKANMEEVKQAVRIAECLIRAGKQPKDIAILTPYNAQVSEIKKNLFGIMQDITVSTIMKSQGSEWRYVILTTVRSCSDIEETPARSWLLKQLGFLLDPNQVNVAITRAQEGLCIIGDKDLLWCSSLWRRLLQHYQKKGCLVDSAQDIQICLRPFRNF